jgi:hypothetical protein
MTVSTSKSFINETMKILKKTMALGSIDSNATTYNRGVDKYITKDVSI